MKFSGQNVCQMYSCFCHFEHSEQNKTSAFVFYTRRPQHKTWGVPLQTVDSFSSFFPQTFVGFLLDSFQDVPLHPGRLFEQEVAASSRSRRSERTAHVVGTALDRFPPLSCLLSTVVLQLDVVLCAHAPRPALSRLQLRGLFWSGYSMLLLRDGLCSKPTMLAGVNSMLLCSVIFIFFCIRWALRFSSVGICCLARRFLHENDSPAVKHKLC